MTVIAMSRAEIDRMTILRDRRGQTNHMFKIG